MCADEMIREEKKTRIKKEERITKEEIREEWKVLWKKKRVLT